MCSCQVSNPRSESATAAESSSRQTSSPGGGNAKCSATPSAVHAGRRTAGSTIWRIDSDTSIKLRKSSAGWSASARST